MKRILVIGCPGSGKTTFSIQLQKILKLNLIHLDIHYWKPRWTEPSNKEWYSIVENLISGETWIIDGNYNNTMRLRFERADTVIFLDVHQRIYTWRIIKRRLSAFIKTKIRNDLPEGCKERF